MIEESIYTALTGHAGLTALVSTRIYPLRMPQSGTFPAVSYMRISGARVNSLDGYSGLQNPRIQVDVWDDSYSGVKAVAEQVRLAFAAASFQSVLIADRDDNDDTAELFRVSMDFSVWSV